jgi:general secretion pathway protein B
MSLILEALRKSEAERRRGLAPDMAMELPPTPNPQARATPAWAWPLLALALLVLGGLGWWQWRDAPTPASTPGTPATASAATTDTPPAARPPLVVRRSAPASTPMRTTATMTTPMPRTAPATQPAPPSQAAAARDRSGSVPPAPAAPPAMPVAPSAAPPPRPMPLPAASTAAIPDLDSTGLAPVKLSMHIWDATPARRFVILDGQRMAEGDRLGGLQVIEIRRDGVVIERDGQRARVPLP